MNIEEYSKELMKKQEQIDSLFMEKTDAEMEVIHLETKLEFAIFELERLKSVVSKDDFDSIEATIRRINKHGEPDEDEDDEDTYIP